MSLPTEQLQPYLKDTDYSRLLSQSQPTWPADMLWPDARDLITIAVHQYHAQNFVDPLTVLPTYLRNNVAKKKTDT